jgi:hypothetical protein
MSNGTELVVTKLVAIVVVAIVDVVKEVDEVVVPILLSQVLLF